jgi:hypothetical protein
MLIIVASGRIAVTVRLGAEKDCQVMMESRG